MIRILLLIFLAVVLVSSMLHISAGWAWILVLAVIGALVGRAWLTGSFALVRPSAMWKCPYCLKRVKLGATACHHCTRSLLKTPL
jgi:hypothetical protein